MFWSVLTAPCYFSEKKLQVFGSSLGNCPSQWPNRLHYDRVKISALKYCQYYSRYCKVYSNFFINHSAALRPTLGHWHGGNLSHHMLITTLFPVRPKVHWEPRIGIGFQSLTKRISVVWAGNLPILGLTYYPTVSLSPKVY